MKNHPQDTGYINHFSFFMANNNGVVTLTTSSPVWWWNGAKSMTFKYKGDTSSESLAISESGFLWVGQIENFLNVDVVMTQASSSNPILQIDVEVDPKAWEGYIKQFPHALYSFSPAFPVYLAWEKAKYFDWTVSGKVTTIDGKTVVPGVTITAINVANSSTLDSTTSKEDGSYYLSLKVPVSSRPEVELKASKTNYSFNPVYVTDGGTYNIKGTYHSATSTKYNIVGQLEDKKGKAIPKVKLEYFEVEGGPYFTSTDSGGYFMFKQVPLGGSIGVIVDTLPKVYQHCKFNPIEITPTNFTNVIIVPSYCPASPSYYYITGIVKDQNGSPVSGAAVKYGSTIVYTKSDGSFEFSAKNLNGILEISKAGYETTQTPIYSQDLGVITLNKIISQTYSIQGHVEDTKGNYIVGAVVTYGSKVATTDKNGYFSFKNIQLGKVLKVSKSGYNTSSQTIDSSESDLIIVLTATNPNPNPTTKTYIYTAEDENGNYLKGIVFTISGQTYTTNAGGEISVQLPQDANPANVVSKIYDPTGTYTNFTLVSSTGNNLVYQGQKQTISSNCPNGYHPDPNDPSKCVKDTVITGQATSSSNSMLLIAGAAAVLVIFMVMNKKR